MSERVPASRKAKYKRVLANAKKAMKMSSKVCEMISNINEYELMQMKSRLLQNMGLVSEAQGKFEKAAKQIEEAISINTKGKLKGDICSCYVTMASLYQKQGNTVLSLEYHDLALEVGEQLSNKTQLVEALYSKADVYFSVENYKAAEQTLAVAYKKCKHSFQRKSVIEKNLKIARFLCNSKEKLTKLSDDDHETMKQVYEEMGIACCAVENFKPAAIYYLKMFECCKALNYSGELLLPALSSLSQTYRVAAMYEESLKYLQKELDILDSDPMEACKKCMNIVRVLDLKGDSYQDIIENLEKAYTYALNINCDDLEIEVLRMKLKLQEKYGHVKDANETRSRIEVLYTDDSPLRNSSNSSDEDEVVTPDFINDLSLADILEANSGDISPPRQVRRQQQRGPKIRKNEKGETQLHVACIAGNYQRVKQLIDLKHPVNEPDNVGWTPLHEVCNHGFEDLVELLLDNGAEINNPGGIGCEGVTPLHDACSNGHLRIVQILLDRGACMDVKTYNNETPLDFLMEWSSTEGEVTRKNVQLFELIRDRLKSGLGNAGSSTESVYVSPVQDAAKKLEITQRKTKQIQRCPSESNIFARKRNWSVLSPVKISNENGDEETSQEHSDCNAAEQNEERDASHIESLIYSSPFIEEDPALKCQKDMKGLRKKSVKMSSKNRNVKKSGALVQDADIVDNRLINDMMDHMSQSKKHKIRESEKRGAKLIGTLRKVSTITGDGSSSSYESNPPENHHMETEKQSSNVQEVVQNANQIKHRHHKDKKEVHRHPSSLLDSGFVCVPTEKNATLNNTKISVVESAPAILAVNVHIENRTLVVPVCTTSETSTFLTIGWLAKEAAKRYLKLEGREPVLVLLAKDGATLDADDPVSIILDSKEVQAITTDWKKVSLMQRYIDACSASDSVCLPHIKRCIQECDVTCSLNLRKQRYYLDSLKPLIKSLHHDCYLKELFLGNNSLMDEGIEELCKIKSLPLLEILDLSCNKITSEGLTSLCSFFNCCQSVKVLDLSYNNFKDDWLESLHNIFEVLKSVLSLNMKYCGMRGDEFTFWKGETPPLNNIHSLEALDLNYNPLGENGINGFLRHLNTSRVRKINVAGTTVGNSRSLPKVLEFFQRDCPSNLRILDISDCSVTDDELVDLLQCLNAAENLSTLLLTNNSSLTKFSLNALMKMTKVPDVLNLCGCDHLFPLCDEENAGVCFDDTFLKKISSLTITCNESERIEAFKKCSEEIKVRWKHIWRDRASVLQGPFGLIQLKLVENKDNVDKRKMFQVKKKNMS